MGGGQRPKPTTNVVLKTPRPKHKNGAPVGGSDGAVSVSGDEVPLNPCKTFYADKPNGAIHKVTVGMTVYAQKNGRSAEVRTESLGKIGFVPMRIVAAMFQEGRSSQWSGKVVEVDIDRLSIKVTLCPA